jgi:uncharacterized membrane protein YkvA (DUF1232 family)
MTASSDHPRLARRKGITLPDIDIKISYSGPEAASSISRYKVIRLGDDLDKGPRRIVPAIEEWLTGCFQEALGHAASVIPERMLHHYQIEVFDDFFVDQPVLLAAYRLPLENTPGTFRHQFRVSGRLICNVFFDQLLNGAGSDEFMATLVHEIMHLIDSQNLVEFAEDQIQDKAELHGAAQVGASLPLLLLQGGGLEDWDVLEAFNGLRAEGLAELGAYLLAPQAAPLDLGAHARVLSANLPQLFQILAHPGLDRSEKAKAEELVRRLKYKAGPSFVLDAMGAVGFSKEVRGILDDWDDLRLGEHGEFASLLKAAARLDIGAYLKALADPEAYHPWGHLISPDELGKVIYIIKNPGSPYEYEGFFADAYRHFRNGDTEQFCQLLEGVVGCLMSDEEISAALAEYRESPRRDDMARRFEDLLDRALALDRRHSTPLTRAILTYALDDVDVIPDDAPYIGLLDDCFVLEYGLALASKAKP